MNIIDTTNNILEVYTSGNFDLDRWKEYMDKCIQGAKDKCFNDMMECQESGFSFEESMLPILNNVMTDEDSKKKAIRSFHEVTDNLEARIISVFHKSIDVDVILYLGLCNGAGWVTDVNGKTTVLLGIEKILELGWCDIDSMNGLIIHELGHAYHDRYGRFKINTESSQDGFLWRLFTEGVAMAFEQEVVGDPVYYHQGKNGWKKWCDENRRLIVDSFCTDLKTMTRENQRYFGDWVSFNGYHDVGYYLGAEFVRYMMKNDKFDNIINYGLEDIKKEFERFATQFG